ncbi:hypothetical protein GQ602_003285 [Ophiocordyceps camponoti-floridani]|uniref:Uncharacterized protein n=1 Tax=Ophiocordyceps camponoti-floridani TaxID=2030778 RepID=A0A8H4VEA6_9HYPO|nr:hypothetical protein GQ602_003285 [Ophiocordyceps camponoti-floridani]
MHLCLSQVTTRWLLRRRGDADTLGAICAQWSMASVPQQPDFSVAARNLESLTEQVTRCQNLPAVDDGRRLTQALEAIHNGMQDIRNEIRNGMRDMRNELRAVERKVDDLDRKVTVSNKNFTARIQNSGVIHDKVDLVCLHSVVTGGLIRDWPRNLQELDALTGHQVDVMLTELGEEGRGRPDERKHQLEMAIGVVSRSTRGTRRH